MDIEENDNGVSNAEAADREHEYEDTSKLAPELEAVQTEPSEVQVGYCVRS